MKKHKTLGQVFTPEWVVNEILDLVGYQNKEILTKKILEPACGDGAFLIEIVKRYIYESKKLDLDNKAIRKGLEKQIYGIELDETEHAKCIENLNLITKKSINEDHLDWKIFKQNTLYSFKDYLSFFDYIVGNPPYIRIHNLDQKTREFLKNNFLFSKGTIDIYLSFFEMAIKMIKADGTIGYISPNSYLHNSSYNKFRDYLKENKLVQTLVDFKANKVFKGFSTYTAITILKKKNPSDKFIYKELINNRITKVNEIAFNTVSNKDWSFTDKKNENFLSDLNSNKNSAIKELFDVQYGFATLRDKIFIGTIKEYGKDEKLVLFNDVPIEKAILKTVVKGSKFKGEIDKTAKIIFPYEKTDKKYIILSEEKMRNEYPHCFSYFLKNKEELKARNLARNTLWYEYGRSQGVQSIHNEKIVLSTLVNGKINFYRVYADTLMYSGIFITRKNDGIDWKIIENVLNSEDFLQFIRLTGKDFSGGYKSISTKQIKDYRINLIE